MRVDKWLLHYYIAEYSHEKLVKLILFNSGCKDAIFYNLFRCSNEKYEIYICSACLNTFDLDNSGIQFKNKYDFLRKNLPFINPQKFILTSSKNMVKADIQIDDYLPNFDNDTKLKILFPSYHNKNIDDEILKEKNIIRAGYDWKTGWQEISKILLKNENN